MISRVTPDPEPAGLQSTGQVVGWKVQHSKHDR